jgi:hypothetical protein
MFFLIRAFFWIGVVFLLMPESAKPPHLSASLRDAGAAVTPAMLQAVDLARSCARAPQACRGGVEAAQQLSGTLGSPSRLALAVLRTPAPPPRPEALVRSTPRARRATDATAR